MKIVCDNCGTKYSIADEKVRGKVFKIKCKKCSHIIVVKGQDGAPGTEQPASFDQKDTRVFDYSGFEGGQAPKETAQAGDAIWHLVIDREQVGPLTLAEVRDKWTRGEIDAESYAWREGFGDWQRIAAIDELAFLRESQPAAAAPAPAEAGLFGSAQAASSDPADLFGTTAAAGTEEEGAGDLFGTPVAAAAAAGGGEPVISSATPDTARSSSADLFAQGGAEPALAGGGGRPLTAQRNENSVLFSLTNLASLATDTKPAAAATGSGAAPAPGFAGNGGTEGSGLIDIRAMAAMTLGSAGKPQEKKVTASADDLPVFSATSFSAPTAGVLLPTPTAERPNKLVYIFMGVVGLLAVAAIVLVAIIVLGRKESPPVTAAAPGLSTPRETATTTPSTTPTTTPTPSPGTTPSATPTTTPTTTPTSTPPAKPAVRAERKPRGERASTSSSTAPAATSPPAATEPRPSTPKCDEVACLVTPDLPCCPKRGGSSGGSRPSSGSSDSGLPEKLEMSDIRSGMGSVGGRVASCNDSYKVAGSFKVRVTVSADGNVSSATAGPPMAGTPTGSCVERAVRGARFKRTKSSITFNYPYNFH